MPLPILHSFAGYSVYRLSKSNEEKTNWTVALLSMFLANLADFDFIPGLLSQHAARFHRQYTHSIGAALVCGLVVALIACVWKKASFIKTFLFSAAAYSSHLVLDYLNGGGAFAFFWPFSSKRMCSPVSVFPGGSEKLETASGFHDFMWGFFDPATLRLILFELSFVLIVLAGAKAIKRYEKQFRFTEGLLFSSVLFVFILFWVALL